MCRRGPGQSSQALVTESLLSPRINLECSANASIPSHPLMESFLFPEFDLSKSRTVSQFRSLGLAAAPPMSVVPACDIGSVYDSTSVSANRRRKAMPICALRFIAL